MKKFCIFLTVAVSMLAMGCSQYHYETVEGDPLNTKIYTLDNGLEVYMTVNKETPRLQTFIAVKVGAKNDPLETTGLAHYFEHLMFKGTEQFGTSDYEAEKPMLDEIEALFETYRQTGGEAERAAIYHKIDSISYQASLLSIPNEYDKLMAVIGANGTNAWTSQDETVYTEDIPSNQIDNWARIQADRFMHPVLRGFHTELETIYEEKNMSITQDSRKVWQALDNALYPNHPYGMHDVLGFQEHLKNPSITNVKKYHDTYYVPNNIRICVSGDFDPDEMVAVIEKYFGDWEPNPEIPQLQYEAEQPITEPVVRKVYGLEAENIALGWRLPGAPDLKNTDIAEIASSILYNGKAGLIDLDVMQQQKVLSLFAGSSTQPDYSSFIVMGRPKAGQTLDEVREIALEEVAKLRAGDFDESLISSTVNNLKLQRMRGLERNRNRANLYVDAFINGIDWADACHEIDRLAEVTKEDVVAWANEFLGEDNYVAVYKLQGEDTSLQKISAPKITPIATNRDKQSQFLTDIKEVKVKPIEPVFVDFDKDMDKFSLAEGVDVLYKQNELNDIATATFIFDMGSLQEPALTLAPSYLDYLGTEEMSAEEFAVKMYGLACSYSLGVQDRSTRITVTGLSENLPEAIKLVEDLITNAKGDEEILARLKADRIKFRGDNKHNQRNCFSSLQTYVLYGPEEISGSVLDNEELGALASEDILSAISGLFTKSHEVLYYGPASAKEAKAMLKESHLVNENLEPLERTHAKFMLTEENSVMLMQYDAPQLYYIQYSDRGEEFDPKSEAVLRLYNEYFGGGMNSIVFQEMREARGLAYSSSARLNSPSFKEGTYGFMAFIATQNDKLQTAVEAFDDIINDMPESEAAFAVAKEALISGMRTARTTGAGVLNSYRSCRELGLDEPLDKAVFEAVQDMTLQDVVEAQQKWIKDRNYTYAILGDIDDLDMDFIKTLGPVKVLSSEEVFGY